MNTLQKSVRLLLVNEKRYCSVKRHLEGTVLNSVQEQRYLLQPLVAAIVMRMTNSKLRGLSPRAD
jgi:hypothetical protein